MREPPDEGRRDRQPAPPDPQAEGRDAAGAAREDQRHLRQIQRERQARVAKVIVALAITIVLIIFIIKNSQPVLVNFVFVSRHPRLIWVMLACAVLGGIVGYLIGRPGRQVRLHRPRDERKNRS